MTDKKKIFEEMLAHLLTDDAPSVYVNQISKKDIFKEYPFSMLNRLKGIPQSPKHHPEGNVWNHTMLVVDVAGQKKQNSRDPLAFMLAALLHDVGKAETTRNRNGRITAYNHEKAGALQAEDFLKEFLEDEALIQRVALLVRWHMQILFVIKSMQFADIRSMQKEIEIEEIALLGYCDRMGRLNSDRETEDENLELFLQKCHDFMTQNN
ncbi:MAG: HDIG domain-containing protein [Eubacteriales bacterium]|nr:HDIG domain-containing protein [Eubacteriales bacterium]